MFKLAFFTLYSPLKWMLPTALHCTTEFLKNSFLVQEDGYICTNALSVDTEISSLSEFSSQAFSQAADPFQVQFTEGCKLLSTLASLRFHCSGRLINTETTSYTLTRSS